MKDCYKTNQDFYNKATDHEIDTINNILCVIDASSIPKDTFINALDVILSDFIFVSKIDPPKNLSVLDLISIIHLFPEFRDYI